MIKIASLSILSIAAALLAFGLSTAPAAAGPNLPDLIITNISTSSCKSNKRPSSHLHCYDQESRNSRHTERRQHGRLLLR